MPVATGDVSDPLAPYSEAVNPGALSWSPSFYEAVKQALYSYGVDPNALSDFELERLSQVLYQNNPYMRNLEANHPSYQSDMVSAQTLIAYLTPQIASVLFNPTQSNNAAALQVGIGLLQKSGVKLDTNQQTYAQGANTKVPLPFDPQYLSNPSLDFNQQWDGGTEHGIDYQMPQNTPLYSPFSGTIELEDKGQADWGKRVLVHLDNGYTFAIGHMTAFNVTNGQVINPGDLLGFSGGNPNDPSSGKSTGEHIEVQWLGPGGNYDYQNPHQIIDQIFKGTTFQQLGQMSAYGKGPDATTQLLGLDPTLRTKYSSIVSLFSQYFGRTPTNSELIGLIGTSGLQQTTPQAGVKPQATGAQQDIRQLAKAAGFPDDQLDMAAAIALAESSGNPNAVGGQFGEKGLWQIYPAAHPDLDKQYNLFDPLQNAQAAYKVWKDAGGSWTPWSTYTNGSYKQYLGQSATVQSTAGQPDMQQVTDRLRGMPSHIPGMNMGQYTDLRAAADKVSGDVLGHAASDGVVADLYKEGYTSPAQVKLWYDQQSNATFSLMDRQTYNQLHTANQSWMAAIYNQKNTGDPRIPAAQVAGIQYPQGGQPGFPASDPGPDAQPKFPASDPGPQPGRWSERGNY